MSERLNLNVAFMVNRSDPTVERRAALVHRIEHQTVEVDFDLLNLEDTSPR
jgi:hypothetical protein